MSYDPMENDRIFKDSTEDMVLNEKYEREDRIHQLKIRVRTVIISIISGVALILYFITFFQVVSPVGYRNYLSVKENRDRIIFTLDRIVGKDVIVIEGFPNNSDFAKITAYYYDGSKMEYRISFSNPSDWGNAIITIYNEEEKELYNKKYTNSQIDWVEYKNDRSQNNDIIITNNQYQFKKFTLKDLTYDEIVRLALRQNIKFRGEIIFLVLAGISTIYFVIFSKYWEEILMLTTKRSVYHMTNYGVPVFTEQDKHINQIIIIIGIVILLGAGLYV